MKHVSIILCHYSEIDDFGEYGTKDTEVRSKLLRQSIESLIKNTDYPADIIVIDNGGNPDDSEYLLDLSRKGIINTYIRNKNNMGFAYAWNQGARLATGDYLCFTCNDILFKPNWLPKTIEALEKFPDRKLIASPFISRDKDNSSCNKEVIDGYRINSMAGSNCLVIDYKTYVESGEFPHHRVGGSIWQRRMIRNGYLVVVPPINYVEHIGEGKGINFTKQFSVDKILLKGQKINFNYTYDNAHKDYYYGYQRISGGTLGENMPEGRILRCRSRQETNSGESHLS